MKLENIKLCPQCGFPNKIEDTFCKYCETLFNNKKVSSPKRQHKGFPVFFSENKNSDIIHKKYPVKNWLIPLILAICMISAGFFLFWEAVIVSTDFKLWLVAILILLYGWQVLGVFLSKFKIRPRC